MKLLFDTNVILDLLLEREPFVDAAATLVAEVERGRLSGWVGATTVTTLHYLAAKVVGAAEARSAIAKLLSILRVAPVDRVVIQAALASPLADFEDAVLLEAAKGCGVQAVVTRDSEGFSGQDLPVYEPTELVAILVAEQRSAE